MANEDAAAVNDQVVADATAPDSAAEETKETVSAKDVESGFDEVADSIEAETEGSDDDSSDDTEETNTEKPKGEKAPDPKDEWDSLKGTSRERFQQTVNERNELRQRLAEIEAQKAQIATEQDLLNEINPETGDYYTPQEASRAGFVQSRQAQQERLANEEYQLRIQQNQASIDDEATKVTQDFELLNPKSQNFNQQIADQYLELLNDNLLYAMPDGNQYNRATLLQNGINPDTQATLVGASISPYKLAKAIATPYQAAISQGETIGQAKAQRATEKMLANADPASSSTGHTPSKAKDPILEGFDTY